MTDLRQLAREEPEAVHSVAQKGGGKLRECLLRILEQENPDMNIDHQNGGIKWE